MPEDNRPQAPGIRDSARAALASGLGLARARGRLLQVEADEARLHLRILFRFAVAGLVAFATGYALLLALGIYLAAGLWLSGRWEIALFAVAALHLFVGAVLLIAVRARAHRNAPFGATLDQFEIDRQWLGELQEDLKKQS